MDPYQMMLENITACEGDNCTLPYELQFTRNSFYMVISYSILFVIAAVGNVSVFVSLVGGRHRKSRVSLMITHLSIADMVVTFVMIPLEIGWRMTTQWVAGNAACKFFLFFRAFGLYLSSNILVCVSLDRYFAIIHPLRVNEARRRGKIMLVCAWCFSFICALPQSAVFHVSQHPRYPEFTQCVSFGFFNTQGQETAYNLFCVVAVYFMPLLVISCAYICILCEISNTSENRAPDQAEESGRFRGRLRLRRSDMSNIEKARARTLRMTITIVVAFIWCWTPYVVMTLWYAFDRESAKKVDPWLQDLLFLMAVSNSCVNPLVYGSYTMNFKKDCNLCCKLLFCRGHGNNNRRSTDPVANHHSRGVIFDPNRLKNLFKGSNGTRTTGIGQNHVHFARNTPQNVERRPVNERTVRPYSLEHLAFHFPSSSDSHKERNIPLEEFHSDPGHGHSSKVYTLSAT